MLQKLMDARALPPLKAREAMLNIVLREEFGFLPDMPFTLLASEPTAVDGVLGTGKAVLDGHIGYQRRRGVHYLAYRDWAQYIAFINRHK